jgi:hypothetical protein
MYEATSSRLVRKNQAQSLSLATRGHLHIIIAEERSSRVCGCGLRGDFADCPRSHIPQKYQDALYALRTPSIHAIRSLWLSYSFS